MKPIYVVNIFAWLITSALSISCSTGSTHIEAELLRVDSLITAQQPDSAWQLLQSHLPSANWTDKETARYALLWAAATDKCVKSLLPCDSLLDVALDYYDCDSKERAIALLYKGRLEVEMEQSERAVNFFLEGLGIIEKYSEEIEIKRHLLCSLGNEYLDANLYEKAGKTFRELEKYCFKDQDKAIACNRMGNYFSMIHQTDSALIYQHQALRYAKIANDSNLIELFAYNLSRDYCWKEKYDTALYYAVKSLQYLPKDKKKARHYSNIGNIYYYKDDLDSAGYYLNKSLEDSLFCTLKEKSDILLKLSYIKEEQKKYKKAVDLLYQFIDIADSIYFTEKSTKIQQLIHQYDIKTSIYKEHKKSKNLQKSIIGLFSFLCLILIIYYQHCIHKREKQRIINEQKLAQAQEKYNNLLNSIDESNRIITLLRKKEIDYSQETEKYKLEIEKREKLIKNLEKEKESLRIWLFKQSNIYKKIEKLSNQKVINKKELTVLTNSEQEILKKVIEDLYADFIASTKKQYPLLTNEDCLFLCLEKIGISNQAIALCFGNTNTHAIAQKKYRIKGRMNEKIVTSDLQE